MKGVNETFRRVVTSAGFATANYFLNRRSSSVLLTKSSSSSSDDIIQIHFAFFVAQGLGKTGARQDKRQAPLLIHSGLVLTHCTDRSRTLRKVEGRANFKKANRLGFGTKVLPDIGAHVGQESDRKSVV